MPAYVDVEVWLINFADNGIDSDTLKWFFAIQTELIADWETNCSDNGFIHKQTTILECFVNGNLYCLSMPKTQSMYDNITSEDPHFMTGVFTGRTHYGFPIFCALVNNCIDILWVAEQMRHKGPCYTASVSAEGAGRFCRRLH